MGDTTHGTDHGFLGEQDDAHEEFHSKPVPLRKRLGFAEPALIWSGFGIAFICAVIGGQIQQGLGTVDAIWAIILGNAILFVYSALLGYPSGRWGVNFPLSVQYVFGRAGAVVPIIILSLLVTGWYAFQAWLTADILRVAFGLEGAFLVGTLAVLAGIIYAAPVVFGIHQMALVRKIAIPAMIVFAIYYLVARVIPAGSEVFSREGDGSIAFWTGVGMAWATFAVSGTMTGDIVRYTRTGGQAVGVTAVAFIFSNAPFMILGALISATINNPDVVYFFDQSSSMLLVALVVLAILSNWSTCDACLYNAAMGFTNCIPGLTWRTAALLGAVIGLVAAGTGMISNVVVWLITIGLIVPPVGGIIMADYYVVRGKDGFARERAGAVNWAAVISLIVGVALGYWVHTQFPTFLFGITGIVSSFLLYTAIAKVMPDALGTKIGTTLTGAEAE